MPLRHRSPRRSRIVAVVGAVLLPLLVPAVAAADDGPSSDETVVGELVQAWPEHDDPAEAIARANEGPLTWIETASGDAVRVMPDDLEGELPGTGVPVGATVSVVVGDEVEDKASTVDGMEPAVEVLSAEVVSAAPAEAPTLGAGATDEVTVVMMIPPGGAAEPGRTLADVVAAVNGPVRAFWNSESNGAVQVTAAATNYDWYQGSADCSNSTSLWNEAAGHAGWTRGTGKHLLVYLPRNSAGCAYGLAEVGSSLTGGGRLYVTDVATSVVAHELGHNFGLGHSSGQQCDRSVDAGTCQVVAYRDYYDVMGISWSQVGSLNAPQAARLGLLPGAQQQAVTMTTAGGSYTLAPLSGRTGTRALRLTDPDGSVYWLEYRSAAGRDSWLGAPGTNPYALQAGVVMHRASPMPNSSLLLDGTPSSQAGWGADMQAVLPVGTAVSIAGGDFTVTVAAVSAAGATVQVEPQRALPVGTWESVSVSGSTLSLAGWVYDPDDASRPVPVHAYVDGRLTILSANGSRPDVPALSTGAGTSTGFSWSGSVAPGTHTVCLYAIDVNISSKYTGLGCRSIDSQMALPVGNMESLSASGSTLSLAGWVYDPDDNAQSVPVHTYVDGRLTVLTANRSRPDVPALSPGAGTANGFSWSGQVNPGTHTVCLYAIDLNISSRYTALGCRTITTQMALPTGAWETLTASGATVNVTGWAFDTDDYGRSVPLHVYVDGRLTIITADRSRPDVGAAYPGAGNAHGFSLSSSVSPGEHRVCVYAIDTDPIGGYTGLGCRTASTQVAVPTGAWETLSASGSTVSSTGWAYDPDDAAAPVPVHVYVDGRLTVVSADQSRPDVPGLSPGAGTSNGWSWSLSVAPGNHTVCMYAIDVDIPSKFTGLGCRTVSTQVAPPVGNWEALSASGATVSIAGWVYDPDTAAVAVPVHVYVDGRLTIVTANGSRPDVPGLSPGAGTSNGFSWSGQVNPGTHSVCLYAIDLNISSRYTGLGCRTITTQMALPVGSWETVTASGSTLTLDLAGWTFDTDDHGRSVPVHVYVDGRLTIITADESRPDVGAAFPGMGDAHGFSWSGSVSPGEHRVCLYSIDTDPIGGYTALGCRAVTMPAMTPAEAITAAWVSSGSGSGPLGNSTGAVQGGLVRGGYQQPFQHGSVYWSPTTGARLVLDGSIRTEWVRLGALGSGLGYPTSDTVCGLVDAGCGQTFEGGALFFHQLIAPVLVSGVFLETWAEYGWEEGPLGYPTSNAFRYGDGHVEQQFQHANLYWTQQDGVTVIG